MRPIAAVGIAQGQGALLPVIAAAAGLCALLLAGCGAPLPTPQMVTPERLAIAGQAEALPLLNELAETFGHGRAVTLSVETAATEASLAALRAGSIDIAIVNASPAGNGQALPATEIARLPIAIIVQADNPVRNLTLDALGDILTGRATDWKALGGQAMPVMALSREQSSPVRARVDAALIASDSRLTPNALILPSDEAMAATVARRPESIGYVTGVQTISGAKIVTVDGQQAGDLARGRYYPLWLPVIVVSQAQPGSTVAAFLAYVNGRQGQRIIAQWGCGPGGGKQ
jgi:phosphate transport system substrate-binding protein